MDAVCKTYAETAGGYSQNVYYKISSTLIRDTMNTMPARRKVYVTSGLLMIVLVFFTGCSTQHESDRVVVSNATPALTTPVTMISTVPAQTTGMIATATAVPYQTYSDPTYPLIMSYPAGWVKNEPDDCVLRDYGRISCNIVNFYSPNPTIATNRTLSVEVDMTNATNLEDYFNHATVALGKAYQPITITRPNAMYQISGYRAYRLDFIKPDNSPVIEIFTISPDNVPYIFTYNAREDSNFQIMVRSIRIMPATNSTKNG